MGNSLSPERFRRDYGGLKDQNRPGRSLPVNRQPVPQSQPIPQNSKSQPAGVVLNISLPKLKLPKFSKRFGLIVLCTLLIIAGAGALFYVFRAAGNPLPADIKSQINYKTLYPSQTQKIKPETYQYLADQKTLNFTVNDNGNNIVFTEQQAPDSLAQNGQVYYPALGLHPYAQFQSKLGPVALAKFWQSGNLTPAGEAGILATHGTLLIAHSQKLLSNAEWKNLFDSLTISP